MDAMDNMDVLDNGGDRYNKINIADKKDIENIDGQFSELPVNGKND
jgi:hypothetical protein